MKTKESHRNNHRDRKKKVVRKINSSEKLTEFSDQVLNDKPTKLQIQHYRDREEGKTNWVDLSTRMQAYRLKKRSNNNNFMRQKQVADRDKRQQQK